MHASLIALLEDFRETGVCLAFSGGVDSALLLALLTDKGIPVTAVTFRTALHPQGDMDNAVKVARERGAAHRFVDVDEFQDPAILQNPPDRCYHCKHLLFETLCRLAEEEGLGVPMDGTNADDLKEYRPGLRALKELGVRSPLAECGITKAQVREMAAELGLSTASRPSSPCMATRLPYGETITKEKLRRIETGEGLLKEMGFPVCRLRVQENLCRIEVPKDQIVRAAELHETLSKQLTALGFSFVTLDLGGFRSGSYDAAAGFVKKEALP